MSKNTILECKIKDKAAKASIMRKAIERIAKQYGGHVHEISEEHVSIMCQELSYFAIDVRIQNGQLLISGEPINIKNAKEYIEQYYETIAIEEEYGTSSEVDENGDLLLTIEVNE